MQVHAIDMHTALASGTVTCALLQLFHFDLHKIILYGNFKEIFRRLIPAVTT